MAARSGQTTAPRRLRACVLLGSLALFGCRSPTPLDPPPSESASRPPASGAPSTTVRPSAPPPRVLYVPDATPPAPLAPATPAKRAYVVAAIGDSLTDVRVGGGLFLRRLAELCPESRFDSYGKGGDMVNQMRRRLVREVFDPAPSSAPPKPRYTHLVVFGGVNDLYSDLTAHRTVKKITDDLGAMYAAARERGLGVVAVTVAPWGGFTRHYTQARGETTAELNRWILAQKVSGAVDQAVDSYPLLACGDRLCEPYAEPFRDGLHFGPEGHSRLAEALHRTAFPDCR